MNKLKWDGSSLGYLPKDSVLDMIKSDQNITYWKFKYHEEIGFCISRQASAKIDATHQCIIDEAKSIFGITKTGTHSAKWFGSSYVLLKVPLHSKNVIQEEYRMDRVPDLKNCLECHPEIKIRMQNLLAFYDIMGVKVTKNCALLRNYSESDWGPVGYRELRIDPTEFGHFPQTIIKTWFDDISISKAAIRMLDIRNADHFYEKQVYVRGKLQELFKRLNNKYIYLVSKIIQRILNRIPQFD